MTLDFYDQSEARGRSADRGEQRPYICILFECCRVYVRVYRRPDDNAYEGRCPKCLGRVRVRVSPDGASARFLVAR